MELLSLLVTLYVCCIVVEWMWGISGMITGGVKSKFSVEIRPRFSLRTRNNTWNALELNPNLLVKRRLLNTWAERQCSEKNETFWQGEYKNLINDNVFQIVYIKIYISAGEFWSSKSLPSNVLYIMLKSGSTMKRVIQIFCTRNKPDLSKPINKNKDKAE
jgi:hypothetical protein